MTSNKVICQSLHTYPTNDEINRFVNVGHIPNSTHVFECGTIVNGVHEVNAYINANGTCSFVNADAITFTGLADVPHHYQDHAHKLLCVGEDENCLRFTDELKIKELECESVKVKDIETGKLHVRDLFKVDSLEVNSLIQKGPSDNYLSGHTHMDNVDIADLSCFKLKTESAHIKSGLEVDGDAVVKSLTCKGLVSSGLSELENISGKSFVMDTLECKQTARIKSVEVSDNLSVYGITVAKAFNSNTITNTGNLVSHDIKALTSTFESVSADTVKAEKVLTKSEHIFGKSDYPQVFLPNDKRYLEIDFPMKGLRAYGYGYAPTQVLDTIILKIKTDHKVESSHFKVGFQYYNAKDTVPNVFKLGEVIYQEGEDVLAVVKLSGNIPIAPYWVITVDIIPF